MYKSEQKTPTRMEELRKSQNDKFREHLWYIQPTYFPKDDSSAIVDIQKQIIRNIENQQGISRFDVFSYTPDIFDKLEVNAQILQGIEKDDINIGRMPSEDRRTERKIDGCHTITKAIASSLKERLLENMIDTEEHYRETNMKKLTFISPEYMLGRSMQNISFNLGLCKSYRQALLELGCIFE